MALNDTLFKREIIRLTDEMIKKEDYQTAKLVYAEKLTKAVKEYLKSGQVVITGTSNQGPFQGTGTIQ